MISTSNRGFVEENPLYNSVNITFKVPVLHFDRYSATYNKVLEDVVVGCTCIFYRSRV